MIYGSYSSSWLFGFYRLVNLESSQKKADQGPFGKLYYCLHRGRLYFYLFSKYGLTGGAQDTSLYCPGWCIDIYSCLASAACKNKHALILSRFAE